MPHILNNLRQGELRHPTFLIQDKKSAGEAKLPNHLYREFYEG